MSITRKWGRMAFALIWVAVLVSGCVGGGATTTSGWTALAADDQMVVGVLPAGQVVALDPQANGAELWTYPIAAQSTSRSPFSCSPAAPSTDGKSFEAVFGQPVLTDELVIFGSNDNSVYALSRDANVQLATRVQWSYATEGSVIGGLARYEDAVYFGSADSNVYALNASDGSALWATPFHTDDAIWSAPAVDKQRVYIGSMDKRVYALDSATGKLIWSSTIGGAIAASVTLADDFVYVASIDRHLYVLRAKDGTLAWQSDDLGAWLMSQPTVRDGYVYVATVKGDVYALSAKSGGARWAPVELGSAVRAGLTWAGEEADSPLVVATEEGKLIGIDVEHGTLTELYTSPLGTLADATVVDGNIYVGTLGGQIQSVGLTESGGALAWVYPAAAAK